MRIIAVHLLNNYSGSPKVLMQLLKCWTKNNLETHLYTCGGDGFLSNIETVKEHFYWYRFAKNPVIRLVFLLMSQLFLAIQLLFTLRKNDILYINTILPFGAGLVGKIIGCKVIYHVHETGIKPKILNQFLFAIVKFCATNVVYVSHFLAKQEPVNVTSNVLYNVIEDRFRKEAQIHFSNNKESKIILMISSLKRYKGINEFVKLAELCPQYIFKLVVNANIIEVNDYFKNIFLPSNLVVITSQIDVHPFYKEASVVVNLTVTQLCQETFGLTILEAMAYGLPTIVPPVGGVVELVKDGENGFLIDSKNLNIISEKLNLILHNQSIYNLMSRDALEKSKFFCEDYFENESLRILSI